MSNFTNSVTNYDLNLIKINSKNYTGLTVAYNTLPYLKGPCVI